jgi:hypothetical protein
MPSLLGCLLVFGAMAPDGSAIEEDARRAAGGRGDAPDDHEQLGEGHGVSDGPAGRGTPFSYTFDARRSFPVNGSLPACEQLVNADLRRRDATCWISLPCPSTAIA